jgi:hypothetical protein
VSALDDIAAAKNALDAAQRRISNGWDDTDNRPAAWKAFGEPSAPVFGTGAPHLPISSTQGGIQ